MRSIETVVCACAGGRDLHTREATNVPESPFRNRPAVDVRIEVVYFDLQVILRAVLITMFRWVIL